MKHVTITTILLSVLFLSSCNTDDDNDTADIVSTGSFSIDNNSFDLEQGFLISNAQQGPNLFYTTLFLADNGYSYNATNRSIEGAANTVVIELYTAVEENALVGAYSFTDNTATAGSAVGYYAINYNIQADTLDDEEDIESGTLTITQNQNGSYNVALTGGRLDITGQDFNLDYDGEIGLILR